MKHKVIKRGGTSLHRLVPDITADDVIPLIKSEAEHRILNIAPLWKQINAISDPDDTITNTVKAVREASNNFETLVSNMTESELKKVDVKTWQGWPDD